VEIPDNQDHSHFELTSNTLLKMIMLFFSEASLFLFILALRILLPKHADPQARAKPALFQVFCMEKKYRKTGIFFAGGIKKALEAPDFFKTAGSGLRCTQNIREYSW